jgi:hypothetical protein
MRTIPSFVLCLALAATAAACSSSSSSGSPSTTPCNQNPFECPSGQTCWPQSQTAFACMNAGPGALGSMCQDVPSSPSCGAGLVCLQTNPAGQGSCLAYCSTTDTSHACTGGATCEVAELGGAGGPTFSVCVPPQSANDAGTEGGSDAGATETGTADTGSAAAETGAGDAPSEAAGD